MDIKISAKHLDLTPAIEEYAIKKIERFPRYFDRIKRVEMVVDQTKNGYALEIITDVDHHEPFVATGEHEDLYACIDLGIDRTVRQLTDHKSKLKDHKHISPRKRRMKLLEIVVKDAIVPNLDASDRDAAIEEVMGHLVEAGAVGEDLRVEFVKAIIKREKRGSTGFGHGVAVPHVKHAAIKEMVVAIGISQTGVDFNALDRQPVYSIFLLLSPEDRPEDHLDAMEAIFGNLSHETFRRFLRQATTVEHVLTLLEEADSNTSVR